MGFFNRSILISEPFENRQMGEEWCLGRASDGGGGASVNTCTYVFLSVEHEAAIELRELTEGHVSVPQL